MVVFTAADVADGVKQEVSAFAAGLGSEPLPAVDQGKQNRNKSALSRDRNCIK